MHLVGYEHHQTRVCQLQQNSHNLEDESYFLFGENF